MTSDLPTMPTVVGHISARHPNIAALDRKAQSIIERLEGLAALEPEVRWEPDEEKHTELVEGWEHLLGGCLRLRAELESEGARRFRRDVRRFLPHLAGRMANAFEGALYMVEELEAFIRDAALGQVEPNLLLDVEPGAPGPDEAFEF